jgi:hypothetical protein
MSSEIPAGKETRKPFVLGVDPGQHTGSAMYDRTEDRLCWLVTWDFWKLYDNVVENMQSDQVVIVFEVPKVAGGFRLYQRFKEGGQEEVKAGGPQSKVAANIGANAREGTLLAQRFADMGFDVWIVPPPKRAKKWTAEDLYRETKFAGRSSEHSRDAARVAWRFVPDS